MMHGEDLVVYFFSFRGQGLRYDPQLWNDIDEGIDTAFQLEEFVQDNHFALFKYTIPALEVTSFIANDVFRLVQHSFDLIQGRLCIPHRG